MATPPESISTEQIIAQFIHDTVLASRVPYFGFAAAASGKQERWPDLDHGAPIEHHDAAMDSLVIDVLLSPRVDAEPGACTPEALVERWIAQCLPPPLSAPHRLHDGGGASFHRRTFRSSTILFRSIYSLLRILPAQRIFRRLCSSIQPFNYDLTHKVSSFVVPFSRAEEAELKQYSFDPVETPSGQIVVSVQYRPSLDNFDLKVSLPMPATIITDYVGSPAAEPRRPFPCSLPNRESRPIKYQCPPPSDTRRSAAPSFDRPHSWNNAPMAHHTAEFAERKGSFGFDDSKLSPQYSTSPSPSPLVHGVRNSLRARLHPGTAPVSIPMPGTGKGQMHHSPNISDPFKTLLPPPSPRTTRANLSSQVSLSNSRSFRKLKASLGDNYSNLHMDAANKSFKVGQDDSGWFFALSSGGSPMYGFSKVHDDFDDGDFSYPFAVDDADTSDPQTRRLDSTDAPGRASTHKSQEAAVGILIRMLRTAPPLRQDQDFSSQTSEFNREASISSSRKTADALEELQRYREVKNLLFSKRN